ncbi:MAG: bifunctional UDP-N-acetylglucosamine diphosphorylase/glucosamine-1-phosphate N-acetyltransferase GlmU [Candidatus Melainabacteria bacterium]|nr:bifunctional UDP-N-acetylglucosamine diphosphorylase/glucosamine-1-phosphate N-acetyltransferase GlmU [Candidatus Melainabacteria bacterium]
MNDGTGERTRVVLLAAGQGKRMKSDMPKVLHEVLGKTILGRLLAASDELQPEHIHVVIGHEAEKVEKFIQDNPSATPVSTHLQKPQLGTGHALMQVAPSLKDFKGLLVVSVADTPLLTGGTLKALVEAHKKSNAVVSLLTTDVDDAKNYGRIVRNEKGDVTGIVEHKDASEAEREIKEINPAIYCFAWPEVEAALSTLKNDNQQKEYYLTDVIGWAHKNSHKIAYSKVPDWREVAGINSRLELAEAMRLMRDITVNNLALESGVTIVDTQGTWIAPEVKIGKDTVVLPGCYLVGEIEIGQGCTIGPNTVMKGVVHVGDNSSVAQSLVHNSDIGSNCKVGPFSHLREHTVLHDQVKVGNFVEVKKSIINSKTNASHLSYIGDSTLGSGVNIGAGTITANYDHITKKKERTTICDGASTGSNSVLVAPVTLEEGSVVAAGSVVTKTVPKGALAVTRPDQRNVEGWADQRRKKAEAAKLEASKKS